MYSNAIPNCAPAVFLALLSICACSIKEDRGSCPCYLTLALESGAVISEEVSWFLEADAFSERGEIVDIGVCPGSVVAVPRTEVNLSAVYGAGDCLSDDGAVNIGQGAQCPPVYLYHSVLDTRSDSLTDTIRLHKNYAVVKLSSGGSDNLSYCISGDISGYDRTGKPLDGHFDACCQGTDGIYTCRVPRQVDRTLRLNLYKDEIIVRSFPLGEYIHQSGYDWLAEDLDDIDVSLDLSASEASVEVNGWRHRLTFYIDF